MEAKEKKDIIKETLKKEIERQRQNTWKERETCWERDKNENEREEKRERERERERRRRGLAVKREKINENTNKGSRVCSPARINLKKERK